MLCMREQMTTSPFVHKYGRNAKTRVTFGLVHINVHGAFSIGIRGGTNTSSNFSMTYRITIICILTGQNPRSLNASRNTRIGLTRIHIVKTSYVVSARIMVLSVQSRLRCLTLRSKIVIQRG